MGLGLASKISSSSISQVIFQSFLMIFLSSTHFVWPIIFFLQSQMRSIFWGKIFSGRKCMQLFIAWRVTRPRVLMSYKQCFSNLSGMWLEMIWWTLCRVFFVILKLWQKSMTPSSPLSYNWGCKQIEGFSSDRVM